VTSRQPDRDRDEDEVVERRDPELPAGELERRHGRCAVPPSHRAIIVSRAPGRHRGGFPEELRLPTVARTVDARAPARDLEVLARGDHERARRGAPAAPISASAVARALASASSSTPRKPEPRRRPRADLRRVLAHPAGEHERVEAAEGGRHRGDAGAQAVDVDVDRQPGVVVVARQHGAHVGVAGQAAQAALASRAPARGRRRRRPWRSSHSTSPGSTLPARVAMTRPSIGVKPIVVSTQRPSRTAASDAPAPRWQLTTRGARGAREAYAWRQAVEAEAPHAEALAPRARQRVGRRGRRQRRVERRVEAGDRGHVGQRAGRRRPCRPAPRAGAAARGR
jgi:hypothetical protein